MMKMLNMNYAKLIINYTWKSINNFDEGWLDCEWINLSELEVVKNKKDEGTAKWC